MDQAFQQLFQTIPYEFFEGVMALTILLEFFYTFFENWDML
jgi:hypothetical protein